jgi:hypothetical protein
MYSSPLATFATTTSFGSWLPGDARGYVDNGLIMPPRPLLHSHVQSRMRQAMVAFSPAEQDVLFDALQAASQEFAYQLTDAVIEATHVHWVIGHDDPVPAMIGRPKTRMRQRIARGRIWTADYCHRVLFIEEELYQVRLYLTKHAGLRMLAGRAVARPPG